MAATEYLQREVGNVLGKAMAATAIAMPDDPVEFLARWLINHQKQQETFARHRAEALKLEDERKRMELATAEDRRRLEREEAARIAKSKRDEELRIESIRSAIEPVERAIDTSDSAAKQLPPQKAKADPLAIWNGRLAALKVVAESKEFRDQVASARKPRNLSQTSQQGTNQTTGNLLSLALHLVDLVDEPFVSWKAARAVMREESLADHMAKFDPYGRQRSAKFRRVERRVLAFSVEDVKKLSFVTWFIREWLRTCVGARRAAAS